MRGDIQIKEFENASGTVSLRVSGIVNGERRRENFSGPNAHAQALTVKQNWERERANMAPLPAVTTRLTPAQCCEAESCFHRLAGHALTMTRAVDFALANWQPSARAVKVQDATDDFIEHKRAQNCRTDTLRNLEGRLYLLDKCHGQTLVSDILPVQLRPLIHRPVNSPQTINNNRIALFGFFKWCVKEGYRADNPVSSFEPVNTDDREPEILSLADILKLLRAAAAEPAALLPYVVLGLFCGIRPAELRRLSWDDVDLAAGTVTISGKVAKMRGRRIVSISDNAAAFLLEHAAAHTPLVPANWRKEFSAVRAAAGLDTWTPDALRHTAISYHLGKHQNESAAAAWAGNSADVIHRHYKGLVKAADVVTFWGITPASLDNITAPNFKAA